MRAREGERALEFPGKHHREAKRRPWSQAWEAEFDDIPMQELHTAQALGGAVRVQSTQGSTFREGGHGDACTNVQC